MILNADAPSTRQFFALFDQESLAKLQEGFYTIGLANAAIIASQDETKFGTSMKSTSTPMGISVVQFLALCLTRLGLNSPARRVEAGPSLANLLEMIISFFRQCDRNSTGLIRWTDCVARYNTSNDEHQSDQIRVRKKRLLKAKLTKGIVDSLNHGPGGIAGACLAKIGKTNFVLVADSGASPPALRLLKLGEHNIEVWKSLPFKHEQTDFTESTIMSCGYCPGDYTAGALLSSQRICFWDTRGTVNECRMKSVMKSGNLATTGLWPSVQLGNRWVTCARVEGKSEGLVTGHATYCLTVWDHFERRSIGTMKVVNSYKEGREAPTTTVIDAGRDRLATSALNGTVLLWDASTVRTITRLNPAGYTGPHAHGVASLAYKEDRRLIFTAQYDGICKVYSSQATALDSSGGAVATLGGHQASLVGVAAIEDSDTLVTADRMGSMKLWDIRTWRAYQTISPARLPAYNSLIPYGTDRLILVGDKRLNFMDFLDDADEEYEVKGLMAEASSQRDKQEGFIGMGINYVDREILVACSSKISVYSVAHGKLLHEMVLPHIGRGFITAFAIDEATYESFFIGSSTGQVTLHNITDGTLLEHFNSMGEPCSLNQPVAAISVSRPLCTDSTDRPIIAACSSNGTVAYKVQGSSEIRELDILDAELHSLVALSSVIVALSRTHRRIYSIDVSDGTVRSASISNTGEMVGHCGIAELSSVALLMSSGRVQVWRCLSGMPPALQQDAYVADLSHARTICHLAPYADLTFLSERASEVDAGLDEIAAIDGDVDFLLTSSLRAPTKHLMSKQAVQLAAHKSLFSTSPGKRRFKNTCSNETRHEQLLQRIGDAEGHSLIVANKAGNAVVIALTTLHEKCRFSVKRARRPPIEAMLHFTCSPILVVLRAGDRSGIEIWEESGDFLGSTAGDGYQLPSSLVHLGTNVCTSLHAHNVMKELVGGEESSRIFTARSHCLYQNNNNPSAVREARNSVPVVDRPVSQLRYEFSQSVGNPADGEEGLRTPKSLLPGNVIKDYTQDHSHDMDHPGVLPAYLSGSESAKNLNIKFNKIDSQYWYRPSQLSSSRRSFRSFAELACSSRGRKLSMAARSCSAARTLLERQPSHAFVDSQSKQGGEVPRRPRSSIPFGGQRAEVYLSRSRSASRVRSSCRGSAVDSRRAVPPTTAGRLRHDMRSAASTASTAATRPASRMSWGATTQRKKAYQVDV
ncbi:hypothetical protein FOL47_004936 [Perkinsus chesapeaki]|uniref:Uncharacterized protein n=1 Tax=Perkinsus chesapeaki TaxID=330153 RepID=A0A7J6LZY1_PERCH|nr:hypothetical protein FOL47_004936 [Perkinsus chesapeaki]